MQQGCLITVHNGIHAASFRRVKELTKEVAKDVAKVTMVTPA